MNFTSNFSFYDFLAFPFLFLFVDEEDYVEFDRGHVKNGQNLKNSKKIKRFFFIKEKSN